VVERGGERKHAVAADEAVCPVIAHMQAGLRTEPPVSMLSAAGSRLAASATLEPIEEPP